LSFTKKTNPFIAHVNIETSDKTRHLITVLNERVLLAI